MIQLIVGLGNIGETYAQTRHNAGFWLVERLSEQYNISLKNDKRFLGWVGSGEIAGREVRLLMPTTLMNLSGRAVLPMLNFYRIRTENMLVVHDELDIACGAIKLKKGGGHGGHNGLRDIVAHADANFYRLRVGIGRPMHGSVSDFVLGKPSVAEKISIDSALEYAQKQLPILLQGDIQKAQNAINAYAPLG